MKQLIYLHSSKAIDISEKVSYIFLQFLTNMYIKELDDDSKVECKIFNMSIYKRCQFSSDIEFADSISVKILSTTVSTWLPFKKWCQAKDIEINVKKKMVYSYGANGTKGTWWPSIIELIVKDDNEWLFLSKLTDNS